MATHPEAACIAGTPLRHRGRAGTRPRAVTKPPCVHSCLPAAPACPPQCAVSRCPGAPPPPPACRARRRLWHGAGAVRGICSSCCGRRSGQQSAWSTTGSRSKQRCGIFAATPHSSTTPLLRGRTSPPLGLHLQQLLHRCVDAHEAGGLVHLLPPGQALKAGFLDLRHGPHGQGQAAASRGVRLDRLHAQASRGLSQ